MGLMKNAFLEVQKTLKGRGNGKPGEKFMDLWEILRHGGKCKCFQVDCCCGFMKVPTMDGSKKVYLSIIGDTPVYMTWEELQKRVKEVKGAIPDPTAPCKGDCG